MKDSSIQYYGQSEHKKMIKTKFSKVLNDNRLDKNAEKFQPPSERKDEPESVLKQYLYEVKNLWYNLY